MAQVRIRKADEADAGELARLRWDFTLEDYGSAPHQARDRFVSRFRRRWAAFCQSGRWTVWVAETLGENSVGLVGCLWVETVDRVPRPIPHADQMGYVTNVYVAPGWRNRGIGTRLLEAAIEDARARGYAALFVSPSDRSVPYYRRAGFSPSSELFQLRLSEDA